MILASFIIPTLNAQSVLEGCLRSIRNQAISREQIEILVADGGSTDSTREIAERYGAILLENPDRVAESGKRVAIAQARGCYVVFVDSDNELTHPDFLGLAIAALEKFPEALGVESYYLGNARMGSFCVYLTQTLHISDPVTWMISVSPQLLKREGDVELWTFPGESLAYPLGANGFVYRMADLRKVEAARDFEDTDIALRLAQGGQKTWIRLTGRGVHHYVVRGIVDFIRKRRRQTYHFLNRKAQQKVSWTQVKPNVSPLMACLYCISMAGPIWHAVRGVVRTRDWHWLWHPPASLASIFGLAWGLLTHRFSPRSAESEAALQPRRR